MKFIKHIIQRLTLLAVLLASFHIASAVDERYSKPLQGRNNQIAPDSSVTTQDPVFFDPHLRAISNISAAANIVTLSFDEMANLKIPDTWGVTVVFKVLYIAGDDEETYSDSTGNLSLYIRYDKNNPFESRASLRLGNIHQSTIRIISVTADGGSSLNDFKNGLLLENEILVTREYPFNCDNYGVDSIAFNADAVATKGELTVTWAKELFAQEYDLEWTYIDSSALANYYLTGSPGVFDPQKLFRHNSTRVSLKKEIYYIPLLYENKGKLFFRVRASQTGLDNTRVETNWSSDYSTGLGVYEFTGHEPGLNWQATTSFAEDGKRKSVLQYFDGSLRSRQTVTKDNTTDTTIVAETFYDQQGRPTIQVLPTPSLSSIIGYTPNFNSPLNTAEYTKDLYDGLLVDTCNCEDAAPRMTDSEGAARYYSSVNPNANYSFHQYIPDAKGYPFTETRYTSDNTGRISIQGGVGADFQITNKDTTDAFRVNHATKYFYGGADQEELDALFGTEVGNASHYFKNMVRDANGQYSVSYVDMHGRTIATALAGKPRSKLDALPSQNEKVVTKKLLNRFSNIVKGTTIESSKGLVVTRPGQHRFNYSLLPDSISLKDCADSTICYDCIYDLEITISDDCNNVNLGGAPITIVRSNMTIGALDSACNAISNFPAVDTSVYLPEGTYLVTKKLTVNKKAMDYYRDSIYMRRNNCVTLEQFIEEQRAILRTQIICYPSCGACKDSLGTWETFRPKYLKDAGIPDYDTASYRNTAWEAFLRQTEACSIVCDELGDDFSIRNQMLADLTPPYGQYAKPDSIDNYSIFRPYQYGRIVYMNATPFYDANGNRDIVYVNGQPKFAEDLDATAFAEQFRSTWAPALLVVHPEYYKLLRYEQFATSHKWDQQFKKVETYQEAVTKGYLNPGNFTTPSVGGIFAYNSTYRDPFFTDYIGSIITSGSKTLMQNKLDTATLDKLNHPVKMWSVATMMAHCDGKDSVCVDSYLSSANAFNLDPECSGELDVAWRYFREMYLQRKREIIGDLIDAYHNQLTPYVNLADAVDQGHHLNFVSPRSGDALVPGDTSEVTASINSYIADNCSAYATQWWEQLKPCNFDAEDSAFIINKLIDICKEGGDVDHVFGSSSVKPSSSYEFRSFQEFLKDYCTSTGKTYNSSCNAFLITAPRPYDQQPVYGQKQIFSKPDSCECTSINSYYTKFGTERLSGEDFSEYLFRTQAVSLSLGALDTLRFACNGQIVCNFLENPVYLPTAFQCGVKDACASCDLVKINYDQFREEFPGIVPVLESTDSLQLEHNKLFTTFMNTNLGFGKDLTEYFAFMDTCGIVLDPLFIDTLQNVLNNFSFTSVCDSSRFDMHGFYNDSKIQVFRDGVAHVPDSFSLAPTWGSRYLKFDTICTGNVFTVETRIKHPIHNSYNAIIDFQIHVDGGTPELMGPLFWQLKTGATGSDSSGLIGSSGQIGYGAEGTYTPPQHPMFPDFDDWVVIKMKHTADNVLHIYVDDSLVSERYINNTIERIVQINVGFQGPADHGYVDYFKVYDRNGVLQYVEEFEDACSSLGNEPVGASCAGTVTPCQRAFTNYFNGQRGTSFTPAQVDSVYASYGVPVTACRILTSDTLAKWVEDFNYNSTVPKIDSGGCDISHWRINYGGNQYTAVVPLNQIFVDGIASHPPDLIPGNQVGYDYYDTLCINNAPVAFEFRVKMQDSCACDLMWVFMEWADENLSRKSNLLGVKPWGNVFGFCDESVSSICADYSVPVPQLLRDWKVFRIEYTRDSVSVYFDGHFFVKRKMLFKREQFRGFSFSVKKRDFQLDYVRMYDSTNTLIFNEEFNGCLRQARPKIDNCTDCNTDFTAYFNYRNKSKLTYQQIQNLYGQVTGDPLALCPSDGPTLCGKTEAAFPQIVFKQKSPCEDSTLFSVSKGTLLFESYRDSLIGNFSDRYLAKCLSARYTETFTVTDTISEYHYTLYYYDQAGNLVKTVPPKGVDLSKFGWMNTWSDSVSAARLAKTSKTPAHGLNTDYRYNTLNQVAAQLSPDGGRSAFWYDRLGRLVLSQNAKQKAASGTENNRLYSYTLYDHLGRITEVGEIKNATTDPVTDLVTRIPLSLEDWLLNSAANTSQITQTIYDEAYPAFEEMDPFVFAQDNLRNRVSYTSFTAGNNPANFNQATFYSYDIHGNVQSLLQDYGRDDVASTHNIMNAGFNRFKRMDYDYDLVSGKVNGMYYEFGQKDGFGHRYYYDAENRLTEVKTSWNDRLWETDATYEYYKHGPLARTTLGAQKVQGIDYAYTLQGWLKGVNSTALLANRDMGQDGQGAAANQFVAKDAYSFGLNYFAGDFKPISLQSPFPGYSAHLDTFYRPLYNGNISSMTESLEKMGSGSFFGGKTLFYAYRYDQLNRITGMNVLNNITSTGTWDSIVALNKYKERIAYDPNGNITKYLRHGDSSQNYLVMDSLQYEYYDNKNQLRHVTESIVAGRYTNYKDLDPQSETNNYVYDAIGNLIIDASEGITNIKWSVYGKILEITRTPGDNPVTKITYTYDAQGNRISSVTEKNGTDDKDYSWYVRDAQGNSIAVYRATTAEEDLHWQDLDQTERHIYGSNRIGTYNLVNSVRGGTERVEWRADDYRGLKRYELNNHLGNVLATISDKKFGVVSDTNSSLIASYLPEIMSSNSYYPFGSMMPGRMFSSGDYRYGFNGKENDNSVKGGVGTQQDYGMRIYDPRIGRFLSEDPLSSNYPSWSPYPFAMNSPIAGVDLDGLEFFYAADGKLLGNKTHDENGKKLDDKIANSAMLASGVNDKGEFQNIVDLNISASDFRKASNIIGHESKTNDRQEILNIAHTSFNEAKALKVNIADLLSTGFSSVPQSDKVELADDNNSTKAQYSRAGLIHALSGGADPTNGATRWDGTDFLAWGTGGPYKGGHQKLREMGVEIDEDIFKGYLDANRSVYGNSVRYGKTSYPLPHATFQNKSNYPNLVSTPFYESVFGQIYQRTIVTMGVFRFPAARGVNKGKVTLRATTTAGLSIFWAPIKK